MKIGILTLPFHTNYGGILQAFALKTIVEQQGHSTTFIEIDQKIQLSRKERIVKLTVRFLKKNLLGKKNVDFDWEKHHNEKIDQQKTFSQYTRQFVDKYLNCKTYDSFTDIKESEYDAIIVGSDQIWRKIYVPNIESSFLGFAKDWNIRRIAYAPSFGTNKWEYNTKETIDCAKLLSKFDFVSVREQDGVDLCKNYLKHDAKCVLDPTLLLSKNDYLEKIDFSQTQKSKGSLLCYIIDMNDDKQKLVDKTAQERNLLPFTVNSRAEDTNATNLSIEDCIQPPLEQWLRGFIDAEYIITDSFHACVFSIIFGKQFLVYGNEQRGLSRFYSLLGKFGLENRIVTSVPSHIIEDYKTDLLNKSIERSKNECIKLLKELLS